MKNAHYAGQYVDGRPVLWFFDGIEVHDLVERCRLQGMDVDDPPDWLAGPASRFLLARMILTDAGAGTTYIDEMDRHFAQLIDRGCIRRAWTVRLECVHAWMVQMEPLRKQLRTLFGRDCPSCG